MSYALLRPRRGTKSEWEIHNPILYEGEFVVEHPESGVGTGLCRFKIGDGVTHYRNLPYAFDGMSAFSIIGGTVDSSHLISLRSGTTAEWKLVDPVLEKSEISFDTDMNSFKVGDGIHKWSELKYISSSESLDSVMDFGDEDLGFNPDVSAANLEDDESIGVNDGTATLSDLLVEDEED